MKLALTDPGRRALRQLQKQRRGDEGYVKGMVVLRPDNGWPAARVAKALGLDEATRYRHGRAFTDLGLVKCLAHERPGYWGLLTSAPLAHFCQQVNAPLYTEVKALQLWVAQTFRGCYSVSELTELLHRLGFPHKPTTPVPCQAEAGAQEDFLQELAVPGAHVERGDPVLCRRGPSYPQPAAPEPGAPWASSGPCARPAGASGCT